MEDNPYSLFAQLMKPPETQLKLYKGEVIKISPLTINAAGIELSGNELMVNAAMLKHNASVSMVDVSGSLSASPVDTLTISSGNISATSEIFPDLAIGDSVLLLTTDAQLFYVLCKVVNV